MEKETFKIITALSHGARTNYSSPLTHSLFNVECLNFQIFKWVKKLLSNERKKYAEIFGADSPFVIAHNYYYYQSISREAVYHPPATKLLLLNFSLTHLFTRLMLMLNVKDKIIFFFDSGLLRAVLRLIVVRYLAKTTKWNYDLLRRHRENSIYC